jgi:hypothetical protein
MSKSQFVATHLEAYVVLSLHAKLGKTPSRGASCVATDYLPAVQEYMLSLGAGWEKRPVDKTINEGVEDYLNVLPVGCGV